MNGFCGERDPSTTPAGVESRAVPRIRWWRVLRRLPPANLRDAFGVKPATSTLASIPRTLPPFSVSTEPIVRIGYPWWLRPFLHRNAIAITLGRRVYMAPEHASD